MCARHNFVKNGAIYTCFCAHSERQKGPRAAALCVGNCRKKAVTIKTLNRHLSWRVEGKGRGLNQQQAYCFGLWRSPPSVQAGPIFRESLCRRYCRTVLSCTDSVYMFIEAIWLPRGEISSRLRCYSTLGSKLKFQSWALSVFFNCFNNKKWFFCIFIKLIAF